eukprot:CAMPEP_0119397776 /NCGR_PEP_ID=MMETSP1334-20130426/140506_1 /TAXON_ID=127549 /ORGANISM="Calcidiscus leptoporus, Strain RCC1130" /LENGTH=346 /DNA_ID=CAMNT_0007421621 /DNA_START=71 /DNA_END=1111 /DNA_ORIENTATION=+
MPSKAANAAAAEVAVRDAASRVLSNFVSEADIDPDDIPCDSEVRTTANSDEVAEHTAQHGSALADVTDTADAGARPEAEAPAVVDGSFSCVGSPAAAPAANCGGEADDGGDPACPQAEAPAVVDGSFSCVGSPAAAPAANCGGEADDGVDPALDSDFVYEEGEHSVHPEASAEVSLLLHRFAALTGTGEVRAWFDGASEVQLLALVRNVRELHDAFLQSQAQLINNEVKRNLQKQSQRAATLANELSEECQARETRTNSVDAEAVAALEDEAAKLRDELQTSRERCSLQTEEVGALEAKLHEMEQRLLTKDAEAKQLTEQLQQAILMHKGVSEVARKWKWASANAK